MNGATVDRSGRVQTPIAARIDGIGWGVFLMWVGVALWVAVGWPLFFVGAGLIMLGGQAVRRHLGLPMERFALVLGSCFVLAGGWHALGVELGAIAVPAWLLPLALVAAGAAIVFSAWRAQGPRS